MQIAEADEEFADSAGSGALRFVLGVVLTEMDWGRSLMIGNDAGKVSELICCELNGCGRENESLRLVGAGAEASWVV